jgi:hypothetical protein
MREKSVEGRTYEENKIVQKEEIGQRDETAQMTTKRI